MDTITTIGVVAAGLAVAMIVFNTIFAKLAHDWAMDHNVHGRISCYIAGTLLWLVPGGTTFWIWNVICYFILTDVQLPNPAVLVILIGIMFAGFLCLSLASVGGTIMYIHWSEERSVKQEFEERFYREGGHFEDLSSECTM